MAKKTHIKVRMVPESNPDSKFIYYAKKPTKGEKAKDLGLNETEFAFYNILNAEVVKSFGEETFSDEVHERILSLVKKLVNQFEESSNIVGFFLKQDEIKTMQRNIKRAMIEDEFDDPDLRKIVIERFMELAKVKFK